MKFQTPSNSPSSSNREHWLETAINHMRPWYESDPVSLPIPTKLYISTGFPSTRALAKKNPRIGECWNPNSSKDGNPHIYISPLLADGIDVLACLVHELIHAGGISGHKNDFKRPAIALGLTGKMTATAPGEELVGRLNALLLDLGPYPHAQLFPSLRPAKKQSTRLLKATCEDCESIIRLSNKVIEYPGLPTCACGGEFQLGIESSKLDWGDV